MHPFVSPQLDLTLRVGTHCVYRATAPTPALVVVKPRQAQTQFVQEERVELAPNLLVREYDDEHGNVVCRVVLQPGENRIRYDAIVRVPVLADDAFWTDGVSTPDQLPAALLRYTFPSRYADSDRLRDFAWTHFGQTAHGLPRVRAICDWIHRNIEYRTCSGDPTLCASDVLSRRYGVCRDFAHVAVALCRTFNLPARYVTGYLGDVGVQDPGTPGDFHAYFEVYLADRWQTFDARFGIPRIGRIRIASGLDAANCAFTTLFGDAALEHFEVWSYQVDPRDASTSRPVNSGERLDGTPMIRYSRD